MSRLLIALVLLLSACVRREGRNADCHWPPGQPAGLRADLEFAEELAIRYMESHAGPRDQTVAAQAKNRCMEVLIAEIGKRHGISAQEVFRSFGRRSAVADIAMHLPLFFALGLAADFWVRRFPQNYAAVALSAAAFGIFGLLLGQQLSELAEAIRIGTTHLSNRAFRLPLHRHPFLAFAFLVTLFLSIALWRRRT